LIGWQVNQGRARAATYYLAQQLRKELFRPDVIRRVLEAGSVEAAVAQANAEITKRDKPGSTDVQADLGRMAPPKVRILSPAQETRTREARVTVRVEAVAQNDLPILEVVLKVNGVPVTRRKESDPTVERARGDSTTPAHRQRLEVRQVVELIPGRRNVIEALARNAKSLSEPDAVAVECQAPKPPDLRPALYLLAVGISQYENAGVRNLSYARQDAEEFAETWKKQEGPIYKKVETRVLRDAEASTEAIRNGLDWLIHSATQHDVAILFVSSHGMRDDQNTFYLATHRVDPEHLRATGIPYSEITEVIRQMPCKFHLYIDTCYSGAITGAKAADFDDPLRDLVTAENGVVVFTSSTARESSHESPKWQHGAFTKAFLDTVYDPTGDLNHPPDSLLSIKEIDFRLTQGVKQLTRGQQHMSSHIPNIFTDYIVAQYVRRE
jgi:hypothetical protein